MTTKRKYKAPIFFMLFFGIPLCFIVSNPVYKTEKSGIFILTSVFLFLMFLYSISKIVSIEIKNGVLTKSGLGFIRTINLNSIYKYKLTNIYDGTVSVHHVFGLARILVKILFGKNYTSLRSLKIYFKDGLGSMSFDERTMSRLEFNKLITEVKRGKSKFYKLANSSTLKINNLN